MAICRECNQEGECLSSCQTGAEIHEMQMQAINDLHEMCTCGISALRCNGEGLDHFNRIRDIDNHNNDNECGIFSDMV